MATQTDTTERVDRIIEEAWNNGELEVLDEFVASDYVLDVPTVTEEFRGPEGFKEFVQMFRGAFPDLTLTVEDRVVGKDEIADRIVARGTHEGEFMGVSPTGNEIEVLSMVIHYFEDGQIVADEGLIDTFGLLQQLDVVEPPGE